MKNIHKFFVLGQAVLMTFTLFACTSAPSTQQIISNIHQSLETEQNIHVVQESSYTTIDGETNTSIIERWNEESGRSRLEIRSLEGELKTLSVDDGNVVRYYDAEDNSYSQVEYNPSEIKPSEEGLGSLVQNMTDTFEFVLIDTQEVADRQAFHLEGKPITDEPPYEDVALLELWIDTENYLLLGIEITNADGFSMEEMTQEVEFNPTFTDELFTFAPPEGATPK